jgi:hypothetical protein
VDLLPEVKSLPTWGYQYLHRRRGTVIRDLPSRPLFHQVFGAQSSYRTPYDIAESFSGVVRHMSILMDLYPIAW